LAARYGAVTADLIPSPTVVRIALPLSKAVPYTHLTLPTKRIVYI